MRKCGRTNTQDSTHTKHLSQTSTHTTPVGDSLVNSGVPPQRAAGIEAQRAVRTLVRSGVRVAVLVDSDLEEMREGNAALTWTSAKPQCTRTVTRDTRSHHRPHAHAVHTRPVAAANVSRQAMRKRGVGQLKGNRESRIERPPRVEGQRVL